MPSAITSIDRYCKLSGRKALHATPEYDKIYKNEVHRTKQKKIGFMQRLSTWFEQLPLRRRLSSRRCDNQQRRNTSAKPGTNSAALQGTRIEHSWFPSSLNGYDSSTAKMSNSWNGQETTQFYSYTFHRMNESYPSAYDSINSGRKVIRTNPWISRNVTAKPTELFHAPLAHCSLDDSTCSSGYGSQECSPDSAATSPNWQLVNKQSFQDKSVECSSIDFDEEFGLDAYYESNGHTETGDHLDDAMDHFYYELDTLNRYSMEFDDNCRCPESEYLSSSPDSLDSAQSPIYAQPYAHLMLDMYEESQEDYPMTSSSFTYLPCGKFQEQSCFHIPPSPHPQSSHLFDEGFERAEVDFLAELDAQIAELQLQSLVVRKLVDKARERRAAQRLCDKELLRQLNELKPAKWTIQNHFELHL